MKKTWPRRYRITALLHKAPFVEVIDDKLTAFCLPFEVQYGTACYTRFTKGRYAQGLTKKGCVRVALGAGDILIDRLNFSRLHPVARTHFVIYWIKIPKHYNIK